MLRIRSHSSSSASSTGGERRATAYVVLLRWLHVLLCVRTSGPCRCENIFATLPGRLALSLPQNVCAFAVFAHLVPVAAKTFLQRCQVALLCLYLRTCALSLFTCIALTASRSVFAQNTQLSFIVSVL